jgi:hypothetical protein
MTAWRWPDARGWIGIGVFAISVMLLWMMRSKELREDEFFQTIATVIISNGLIAVVSWAYAATKGGGELAERNAGLVETAVTQQSHPQPVVVENPPDQPIPVEPTP